MTFVLGLAITGAVAQDDPHAWLEEVNGEKPLAWVAERNGESTAAIQKKGYAALEQRILGILDSDDRIPYVAKVGSHYYNFWQDKAHERGVWRRTTLEEYRKAEPAWETVIDLDALSAAEGQKWVWHGAQCLPPEYRRCIVSLSPGGSDADIKREFDLVAKDFVKDGFVLPEAKSEVSWIDQDTLYVMTDTGEGSLTTSGYPRTARIWKRGTPLAESVLVYEGQASDVAAGAYKDHTKGYEREFFYRAPTFFSSELFWRRGPEDVVKIDVPDDASAWAWRDWLVVQLRSDWTVGGTTHVAGSLVVARFDAFVAGERSLEALFVPSPRTALSEVTVTRNTLVVNTLDNVKSKVFVWRHADGKWSSTPMAGLPEFGAVGVSAVDAEETDEVWLTVTDFLTPTTLSLSSTAPGAAITPLKALPAFFDATGLEIQQFEATSLDGTKVPYFQVSKKGLKLNGKNPTLLYGYGGFEVSLQPSYSGVSGAAWLEKGGVYVLANIRGGGEFGPTWHQAAKQEHRHKAYEDFAAVAKDLAARKVTSPAHLGAMGGSNGGLLMGNMLTQYPELFGAIVCQVPLLDMKRYTHLLAGASWMEEYGDPDVAEQWKFIQTFSPYHLATADKKYPITLFTTSTKDDRVHPGHARKMVARLMEQGHEVLYWEDVEGGHAGASTNAQKAKMWAMSWTFLWNELK